MGSLLLLNGSPRGPRSNTNRMIALVAEGWQGAGGDVPVTLNLAKPAEFQRALAEFESADTVLLGMPLYVDSMPALVAEFIEALGQKDVSEGSVRIGFLVQSGFPEALHSRGLERYLKKLAGRLGLSYAGTIVRGGGKSLQMMPDDALRGLFGMLTKLGVQLAERGEFDQAMLGQVSGLERCSPLRAAVYSVLFRVPVTQFYWNGLLKKSGAWDRRFDAPYGPAA